MKKQALNNWTELLKTVPDIYFGIRRAVLPSEYQNSVKE